MEALSCQRKQELKRVAMTIESMRRSTRYKLLEVPRHPVWVRFLVNCNGSPWGKPLVNKSWEHLLLRDLQY